MIFCHFTVFFDDISTKHNLQISVCYTMITTEYQFCTKYQRISVIQWWLFFSAYSMVFWRIVSIFSCIIPQFRESYVNNIDFDLFCKIWYQKYKGLWFIHMMIKSLWFFKENMFRHCGKTILGVEARYWDPIQYAESFLPGRKMWTRSYAIALKFQPCKMNFHLNDEKAEQPPQPNSNAKHACRLKYINSHPYFLLVQSTITCYMMEAINNQIFFQDYLQTIHP